MTERKTKALAALLTCPTREQAAAAAGINPRTLRAYLADPEFQRAYQQAFGEVIEDATRQAQRAIRPALSALQEIIESPNEPSSARISAARSVLEYSLKLTETTDILEQIRALEAHE